MDLQAEAVLDERLQHEEHLGAAGIAGGFGFDRVVLGIDPARTAHDLKCLNRVRILQEQAHGCVGSQPAWKRAHHPETLVDGRFDGRNFKFRPRHLAKQGKCRMARSIAVAMIPNPETVWGRSGWPSNLATRCAREPPLAAMAPRNGPGAPIPAPPGAGIGEGIVAEGHGHVAA
jgi:hypothetical protein